MDNLISMIRAIFLTIFLILAATPVQAQKNSLKLIPFEVNEKWGFINDKGKIVIQPQFDDADCFYEGLATVAVQDKYGFIDETGKFIIEPQYGEAYEFSEGLAPVAREKDGLWEYIDYKGETVIEAIFTHADNFSEGLAPVMVGNAENDDIRNGYIDKTGNFIIEPQFGWTERFSNGLANIANLGRETNWHSFYNSRAFIDKTGNRITPFYSSVHNFSEGLAAVEIDNLWGFIDKSGSLIISAQFDYVRSFSEGFAVYECGKEKSGFIDKKGNKLTDCIFKESKDFKEGLAPVQTEDGKWGFIDAKGRFVIKPNLLDAEPFYNGLAKVKVIRKELEYDGFINHSGKFIVNLTKIKLFNP